MYKCQNAMHLARQLFVPAFLTLLLLGILALWWASPAPAASVAAPADSTASLSPVASAGLAVELPGELLGQLQLRLPGWSQLLGLICLLVAGIVAGRISVRTNLYGINTCLAISLCGIFVCTLAGPAVSLPILLAVLLLVGSVKRFCEALRDGYSFDPLFRASVLLGLLVLLRPAALPLLLLLPFGVLLFHRTRRETVVALAGVLLAPLAWSYVNWSLGGSFTAPVETLWLRFSAGAVAGCFGGGFAPWMGVAGGVLLFDLCGIASISSNLYSVGARARYLLLFNIGVLVLCLGLLCAPGAAPLDAVLMAVPSAVLLPFFFVRVHATLASLLYLLLFAAALFLLFVPLV